MLAATGVKRTNSEKKTKQKQKQKNTYDSSSTKRVTGVTGSFRKFHVVVVQNNDKELTKKSVLHVQSCFFC